MLVAPVPETEYARLMALARYEVLGAPPEESFERITALVREVLGVPMAMINFVDQFRIWSQSCVGGERGESPRDSSFCTWAILDREPTIITDARQDPRFAQNPGVVGSPFVQFYGGVPLITPGGHAIGTLCVVDTQTRPFGEREIWLLGSFAGLVVEALELRVRQLELGRHLAASAAQVDDLRRATAHAQTLSAITALFGEDLDPALATEASAALLSQAVDVDWTGLLVMSGEGVEVLSAWDHRAERPDETEPDKTELDETAPVDLNAFLVGASDLASRVQRNSFIDDYPAHPRALPQFVAMGVGAAAVLPLGSYDGRNYVLVAVRLMRRLEQQAGHPHARPWLSSDRALCEAAGRSIRGSLERRAHLQAVEAAAWRDSLTGLGNRHAFDRALALQRASEKPYAVMMIDLDGMKAINDRGGHERGDELLRCFAQALQAEFVDCSGLYRLGGDEFALVWSDLPERAGAGEIVRVAQVAGVVRSGGFAQTSASVGLAYSHEVGAERAGDSVSGAEMAGNDMASDDTAQAVVRLADARMYRHKDRLPSARRAG
ncbi:diguanylate cyclase [Deinococcus sp.]|uniref:sensor domain-containing diguanylate cyclase n=1 Tax=Deinococcus sp. TaxID=47478 RepID=UPI0025DD4FCC|nr:diguanylate cyclase [Deinococcus sp.]